GKGDPPGHVNQRNGSLLLIGWSSTEDVNPHIMAVCYPNFFFVGCQCYTVTRVSVSPYRAFLPAFYCNTCQYFPGMQITNLKTKNIINRYKCQGLLAIDCKRPHSCLKGPHFRGNLMSLGVCQMKILRSNICQIGLFSTESNDRIVSSLMNRYFFDNFSIFTIYHVPEIFLERGQVHGFSVGSDGHPVTATFKRNLPYYLL